MLRISQSINRTYRQLKITTDNFNRFVANLKNLLSNISDTETEENAKTHLMDFFKNTYYHPDYLVAQKGRIDFVIHSSKQANAPVAVLFEVKKCNNSTEMITPEELNRKAMQEILLYYLRERIDAKNTELKYLIITNIYEYYIFDAQEFERIFHSNQKLLKEYRSFKDDRLVSSNTDFFYKVIAAKYIEEVKTKIEFTHFDLRDYSKLLDRNDNSENKKILELYKVFSPAHLLKQSFLSDSNSLDKNFYNELLHIMGLEEVADGGKKIIARSSYKNRQEASMIENAINILDAEEHIDKIPNATIYGKSREEQLFNVALELTITWINRVLFLKLLEAQLIRYQKGDKHYGFLNTETISDYDELNRLFFQVLARGYKDRSTSVNEKYAHVPYLNSSLFEVSKLEHRTILMSNLDSKLLLSIPNTTVLKDKKGKPKFTKLTTLEYLFLFLDSYDFASEGEEDVKEDDKALINASVLGLIFEKINGHKDGAVFTPGFITMYICREAIEKTVIRKFNEHYGWECTTIVELHNKINDIAQANHIINSLKICDPAVGSGHFLVSALNEIIRLKYELGILSDINGKRIRDYKVEIINDELVITDDEGATFSYNPQSPESQRVQETLFMEKQTIIENCLFGVDINPNSVKICRLRLWIELLKNAYYTKESEYVHLETLPNIDINIKCGNSLLYRFAFDTDIRQVLRQSGITITEYREAVSGYKNAPNKSKKKEISSMIASIKSTLRTEIAKNEPKFKQLRNKKAKLNDLETPSLFEFSSKEQRIRNKEINNLKEEIRKIELLFEEIKTNRIYLSAFEWRFEFPEVLSDEGDFIGFDCIIGNPPYIQLQKMGADADVLQQIGYKTFVKTGDLFCLFYELGITLLKKNGLLAYITSNTWLRAGYGESLRRFLLENSNVKQLIDFSEFKVFDSATVRANILFAESSSSEGVTQACVIDKATFSIDKLSDYC
ncbi:type IIG restriction enzyme/methyltransferase, partial [Bacteroides graminisolvens]